MEDFSWAQAGLNFLSAGRVKRCSSKQVEVIDVGSLRLDPGWHNKGYIFPDGFCTRTVFRSSVCHLCFTMTKE